MDSNLCRAFFWKNFLFMKSNWLSSFIINLACIVVFYVYCKSTYHVVTTPTTVFESKDTESLKLYFPANSEDLIYFSPANAFLDDLMERVRKDLFLPTDRIKPFNDSATMMLTQKNAKSGNSFAVIFSEYPTESNADGNIRYSISSTVTRAPQKRRFVNDEDVNGIIDDDEYVRSGYLTLQHTIDSNFIKSVISGGSDFKIELSPLPILGFESVDGQRIKVVGFLFAVLFNVILLSIVLVPLVEEKQDGMKEFLVLATPYNFLNGLTFFCIRCLACLPFISGCIIIAYAYQATGLTSMAYFILLVLYFCIASTCYTFLISICFKTVFYAKVGGFLLLIIPFFFYLIEGNLSAIASLAFATTSFLNGLHVLQIFTNKHCEFSSSELFTNISDTKPNMFIILTILLFQCLFYTILYNYLSRIFPGRGGLKQHYLFFLKSNNSRKINNNEFISNEQSDDNAVIIQDLTKVFRTKNRTTKVADRLNMKIKNRTITVLLGHNGAGKTTMLNMIIGCVPKDSGKIVVCSEREVSSYRHLIGFCPQHCMFMQYMTCYQHFRFFAQLRGKTDAEADSLASELLTKLKLVNKANEHAKNLSGGMKRRLSLGIALSGETKVVILDEPSSGLDVESRRELWDVLLEIRKTKAVLITTHHMEEAEILGDTISILSNGKLEKNGSPLELKRQYGSGYVLKLQVETHFNNERTLNMIQSSIPSANVIGITPPSVLIRLPYSYREHYSAVLENLESNKTNLGISSIAITDTSLEEVFLNSQASDVVDSPNHRNGETVNIPYQKLSATIEWTTQFRAIFYKKMLFITNQWIGSFIMFCLPFLAIGLAITVMRSLSLNEDANSMRLSLKHYRNGFIYLRTSTNLSELSDILKSEIENNGIQTKVLSSSSSFEEDLIKEQSHNLYEYFEHAIGAIFVDKHEYDLRFKIYYSTNIIHSSVTITNLIDNVILKFKTSLSNNIETIYEPIQRSTEVNPKKLEYFAAIVPMGFFLYMLYYVALPFRENKTDFKSLQPIPRTTYWISFFIFDALLHAIICIFCFLFQYIIIPSNLYSNDYQILLILTYFFYGLSYLPLLYCFTIGFRSISPLSTYLFFMFIVSSIVPFITSSTIQSMQNFEITIMIMSLLPDFAFSHQLRAINENFIESITQSSPHNAMKNEELPSLSTFFIFAIFKMIVIKLFLIYIWDSKAKMQYLKNKCLCCRSGNGTEASDLLDREDEVLVQKEKSNVEQIIQNKESDSYPLLVHDLHKFYGRNHAVRGINFAVKKQECFGLLGVNGAGKTSTFQMIAANLPTSNGRIYIDGYCTQNQESLCKYHFGYCPQGDCLADFMTSYQILKYMAILRNINTTDIQDEVHFWLSQLGLLNYQNVPIRYYSGGTKRKLNAAIAMIGNPSLILLDEPTTGVDPISRRLLWKCIQNFQSAGRTIVLTSHSLDECEHLCNRLAIMTNGKLRCIGSIPYLKKQHGSGFTINVKMLHNCPDNKITSVTLALQEHFDCILREHHAGMLTYFVKDKAVRWSDVFRRTESIFNSCIDLVEDYSISETTLEDIFLKFDEKYQKYLNENEINC